MDERETAGGFVTSTVRFRREVWVGLRRLAELKAMQQGGRPSASAVVEELVEAELVRQAATGGEVQRA